MFNTIIGAIATIVVVTLILVALLLVIKAKLTPSGTVTININDGGSVISSNGPAISLNGHAIVNVEDGATVTGPTGTGDERSALPSRDRRYR